MPPLKKAQIAYLKGNEALTKVLNKYINFADVFLPKLVAEYPKHLGINNHTIKLVDDWQPSYGPIYYMRLVELETLKAYIEINLANNFIRPSKSPAEAPIFFKKKPDWSIRLCIDYRGLNNLTMKNWYPLLLLKKLLDRLG